MKQSISRISALSSCKTNWVFVVFFSVTYSDHVLLSKCNEPRNRRWRCSCHRLAHHSCWDSTVLNHCCVLSQAGTSFVLRLRRPQPLLCALTGWHIIRVETPPSSTTVVCSRVPAVYCRHICGHAKCCDWLSATACFTVDVVQLRFLVSRSM